VNVTRMVLGFALFSICLGGTSREDKCKEALPINMENMTGQWRSLDDPFDVLVSFCTDSTFNGTIDQNGKIVWEYRGRWKMVENKKYMEYTFSSVARIPVGTGDTDEVLTIGCDTYKYRSLQGKIKRYRKIGPCKLYPPTR
jgi:hypothetical protein